MLPLSICNPKVRLGSFSPALSSHYFSNCLIDVVLIPMPTFILVCIGLPFLYYIYRRPSTSTYYHPYTPKVTTYLLLSSYVLMLPLIFFNWYTITKLISSSSGMGLLLVNTFGIVLVISLYNARKRNPLKGRELGLMLRAYWFIMYILFFLKARMLVYLDEINYTTGYYGPSSYPDVINMRDNYIIAALCFSLGLIESLTLVRKVVVVPPVEVEVIVLPRDDDRDLPPLPRSGDVV